jgi:hypothetical protein
MSGALDMVWKNLVEPIQGDHLGRGFWIWRLTCTAWIVSDKLTVITTLYRNGFYSSRDVYHILGNSGMISLDAGG